MNTTFSYKNQLTAFPELEKETFDLIVIGGGITGAGIALDAASRGLSVCLFEKQDFASGTSSRSSKLIHGGLRYLKQFDFKLVRDTGSERAVAYKNAPHIVIPEKMLLPIIEKGSYGKFMTWVGLTIYDWLAGVKKEERKKILNKEQVVKLEPKLRTDILKGGGYYTEYRTDDARLTIEVIKTAIAKGAKCFNYTTVEDFLYDTDGKIEGVKVKNESSTISVNGKHVVNATGPWTDGLREKDGSLSKKKLHLTKGVHIVVPNTVFHLNDTIYFDVPGGRMIFAIPRGNITYIGTTDTNYNTELEEPNVTLDDVNYLLNAVNNMFPSVNLKTEHIISSWSGLRPLIHEEGKDPSEISRKDEIFQSKTGLITIAGGKLTGYRLMAKKITDLVCKRLNNKTKCKTKHIILSGGTIADDNKELFIQGLTTTLLPLLKDNNLVNNEVSRLYNLYGANTSTIIEIMIEHNLQTTLEAEIFYCIEHESIKTLSDYFIRRSGKLYFNPENIENEMLMVKNALKEHTSITDASLDKQISILKQLLNNTVNFH